MNRNAARVCGAGHSKDILQVIAAFVNFLLLQEFLLRRGWKRLANHWRRTLLLAARQEEEERERGRGLRGGNLLYWFLAKRRREFTAAAGLDGWRSVPGGRRTLNKRWKDEYDAMSPVAREAALSARRQEEDVGGKSSRRTPGT